MKIVYIETKITMITWVNLQIKENIIVIGMKKYFAKLICPVKAILQNNNNSYNSNC